MRTRHVRRNHLAEAFSLPDAPTLVARTLQKSTMTVTEFGSDRPNFGRTEPIPRDDVYLVAPQCGRAPITISGSTAAMYNRRITRRARPRFTLSGAIRSPTSETRSIGCSRPWPE
jgi:hypothetical protein